MKKIIALAGVSASGKTYHRTTDEQLKEHPFVDIADVYEEFPDCGHAAAFAEFMDRTVKALKGTNTLVLEAAFLPNSQQRVILRTTAAMNGATVVYIDIPTPPKAVLLERVHADYRKTVAEHPENRRHAFEYLEFRKQFIENLVTK